MGDVNKKYQVFVSSTYTDLLPERQEIMQALLELDCIPAGMELFPASNEDQRSLIKGVIDECDYYVVVIGGRYGSIGPEGLSYTEMEYRYAVETNKPVIAFLHKDPESISKKFSEKSEDGVAKLGQFRKLAEERMCKYWTSAQELGSVVSRSLIALQKKNPGIGWVRGNLIPTKEASIEILNLKKQIEALEKKLQEARTQAPEGSEEFAQGEDNVELSCTFKYGDWRKHSKHEEHILETWDRIFYEISPLMIDEISNNNLKVALATFIAHEIKYKFQEEGSFQSEDEGVKIYDLSFNDHDFQTVKVQLRALGLITKSIKSRSVKNTSTYWSLTPFGDEVMTRLRAIKKMK